MAYRVDTERPRRADRLHPPGRVERGVGLGPALVRLQPVRPPAPGRRARSAGWSWRPTTSPTTPPAPAGTARRSSSRSRTGSATGKYTFGGKSYEIPVGTKVHAIHGFAIAANWDVVEHGATADEAFIVGRYHLAEHSPEMRPLWPTDAILTVRYALSGRRLTMTITVEQPDRPRTSPTGSASTPTSGSPSPRRTRRRAG